MNVEVSNWQHIEHLFGEVPAKERAVILEKFEHKPFEEGQTILTDGSQSDQMFIVAQGELLIFLNSPEGRIDLRHAKPGDFFGEVSVFDPGPVSANVEAQTDGDLLAIKNTDLFRLFVSNSKLVAPLMKNLSIHLTECLRKTSAANFHLDHGTWHRDDPEQHPHGFLDWVKGLFFGHEDSDEH